MAEYQALETLTLEAAADLSACQYHAVRLSAPQRCNIGSSAADGRVMGVLINKPRSGEFATVAYFGKCKVVAGGAVTAGQMIGTNGSGRAAAVGSGAGSIVFGRALETSTTDGDVITAVIFPPMTWSAGNA